VSNQSVTYLVGACLGVLGLAAFCTLVLAPAVTAYRRPMERVAAVFLSLYILAAFVGLGVLLGAVIILEWPRYF
jgi:predicted PurR-regulated permease PerM